MNINKKFINPKSKNAKHFKDIDSSPTINHDLEKPIFSLRHMNYGGQCCISRQDDEKRALMIASLLRLSQSTWREIKSLPKKLGFEPIPQERFKVTFPRDITPDTTILVAQYDGDGGRFAGYRERDIYHIVLVGKDLYNH